MIGTFIRSTHHLLKSGEYNKPLKIVGIRNNNVVMGDIIKFKKDDGDDFFFFFQNVNANIDLSKALSFCNAESAPIISQMFSKYNNRCMYLRHVCDLRSFGTQMLMLPDDFESLYSSFTQKNRKVLDPIFNKYLRKEDDLSKLLFAFCESPNLFVWGAKSVRCNRISIMTIYRLMFWQNNYSQLVNKLKKGTLTAYNTTRGVLDLLAETQELTKHKRANDVINLFNTDQKKLLKNNFDKLPIGTLSDFAILSKAKQQNFIRKVSTIDDLKEIIRLMEFTTSEHFKWSKQALLDFISNVEGLKCEVVMENDTSVLVKVDDFETVKKLAKTTNWCISKNKSYWNNYMGKREGAIQYIIFDFSKKEDDELSIVGFTTVPNRGIIHAHSFTNKDLMSDYNNEYNETPYASLLSNDNIRQGIYNVISNNKIPLSLITKFKSRFQKWTKEEFFSVFNEYFNKNDYTIYYDNDNKLVISTNNFNAICNFLGKTYMGKFSDSYYKLEHIFFLDFNKNVDDSDKFMFAVIKESNVNSAYESPSSLFNEFSIKNETNFDTLIDVIGLPYNIIRRPDAYKHRFLEAISCHDLNKIDELIECDEIKSLLISKSNNDVKNALKNEIYTSIVNYQSIDLLNILSKHNLTFDMILNYYDVRIIIRNLYNDAVNSNGSMYFIDDSKFDEEKMFNSLINKSFDASVNVHQKVYTLKVYLFDYLIKPYENNSKALNLVIGELINNLNNYRYGGYITIKLFNLAFKFIDINNISMPLVNMLNYIFSNNIKSLITYLLKSDISNENVKTLILNSAPSKWKKEFNKKWGIKEEKEVPKFETAYKTKIETISSNYGTYSIDWGDITFADIGTTNTNLGF